MNYPRLLYRGEPETAEYRRVYSDVELVAAKQDGWRLQRALAGPPRSELEPEAEPMLSDHEPEHRPRRKR